MKKLLDAVTAVGPGQSFKVSELLPDNIGGTIKNIKNFSFQTGITGSPTAVSIDVEGSLDGITFFSILDNTFDGLTDTLEYVAERGIKYIRANVLTLTGGTNPTITVMASSNGN